MIKGRNFKIRSTDSPLTFKAEKSCSFELEQEAIEVNNMPTGIVSDVWNHYIPGEVKWSASFSSLITEEQLKDIDAAILSPTTTHIVMSYNNDGEKLDIIGKSAITSQTINASVKSFMSASLKMEGIDIPTIE